MKKYALILISLFLFIPIVYGQILEPLDLAKKIFDKKKFPELKEYVTGEYKGEPSGEDISKDVITKFFLLGQTDKKAVVNLSLTDSTNKVFDTYLHFEKGSVWKMNAFRALAMTGIYEQLILELEKMTPEEIDKTIEGAKDDSIAIFKSRDDYRLQLGNLKLTLESDDNIIIHFMANRTQFEELKNLAQSELNVKSRSEDSSTKLLEDKEAVYKSLLISGVLYGDYLLGGNCLSFLIGGMIDNTVGYLYVDDKKDLPEMSPSMVIMIREIGDGWYMYKTT